MLGPFRPGEQTLDNEIYIVIVEIFAKLTYKNEKNQEYFMKKNGYRVIKAFLNIHPLNLQIARPVVFTLTNCCDQNDYQLIFWSNQFIDQVNSRVKELMGEAVEKIEKNKEGAINDLKSLEIFFIFLEAASRRCGTTSHSNLRGGSNPFAPGCRNFTLSPSPSPIFTHNGDGVAVFPFAASQRKQLFRNFGFCFGVWV